MQIIFLFDGLDGQHREYELSDELKKHLSNGGHISIRTCHPDSGEVFIAEAVHNSFNENPIVEIGSENA